MKKQLILLFFIEILNCIFLPHKTESKYDLNSSKAWCWTKPYINRDDFILNESNGGVNWGYCKEDVDDQNKQLEYIVYITTSNLKHSNTK
jgi:hypothetical protein